jgi:hypothetical protein
VPSYRLRCRRLCVVGVLAGLAHLLVPDRLLATARWGYDRALATDFDPRPNATRRVRIVGLAMLCAALLGYRTLRE